jgi:hypothetical protein
VDQSCSGGEMHDAVSPQGVGQLFSGMASCTRLPHTLCYQHQRHYSSLRRCRRWGSLKQQCCCLILTDQIFLTQLRRSHQPSTPSARNEGIDLYLELVGNGIFRSLPFKIISWGVRQSTPSAVHFQWSIVLVRACSILISIEGARTSKN